MSSASTPKWLIRHAQTYVKAAERRRLATHATADVEAWLGELDRIGGMEAWQYVQAVD